MADLVDRKTAALFWSVLDAEEKHSAISMMVSLAVGSGLVDSLIRDSDLRAREELIARLDTFTAQVLQEVPGG